MNCPDCRRVLEYLPGRQAQGSPWNYRCFTCDCYWMIHAKNQRPRNYQRTSDLRKSLAIELGGRCQNPDCCLQGGFSDIRALQVCRDKHNGRADRLRYGSYWYRAYLGNPQLAREKGLRVLCANCRMIIEDGRRN